MENIIYISEALLLSKQGSQALSLAHYKTLKTLFGECLYTFAIANGEISEHINDSNLIVLNNSKNKFIRFIDILRKSIIISRKNMGIILKFIKEKKIKYIFFENDYYGLLIKKIKKIDSEIKVVTFTQGAKYINTLSYKNSGIIGKLKYKNICYNEKIAYELSDKFVLLNKRDLNNFISKYSNREIEILPVYFYDLFHENNFQNINNICQILFVGSYFKPNIDGIRWFCENVMPKLGHEFCLNIVGKGLEKLKEDVSFNLSNVNIIGTVDDLSRWYNNADIVVAPIFSGDGMKTKTAEALMYGKTILGSKEAFEGYIDNCGILCTTDEDFVRNILDYKNISKKFSIEKRNIFLDNYSNESAFKKIKKLFENVGYRF